MPKISVIMPVYNGEKYLEESISSVLSQTCNDFEFIIIDDGSADNTLKIVESFSDERIKLVKLEHSGIVKALNKGLEIAKGEYIIRTDADDVSLPERFEELFNYIFNTKDVVLCGSWADLINEKGEHVGEMKYPPVENNDIKTRMFLSCPFIHPSVIFSREKALKIGGYRNYKHVEDYEFWTRLLKEGKGHNLPKKLLKYRIHPHQVTKINSLLKRRLIGIFIRILALVRI
jgi:glycosyltransferase involved in cell wall biosynthesis